MMKNRRPLQPLLLLLLVLSFVIEPHAQQPCQSLTPPTPVAGQNMFSEAQEMDLGDAVSEHLQRTYRVIDDEEVTKYLRQIGERIIKHLPQTNLRFQFFLFDINEVNAFTLPGGRIYVSRKMVAFARNEDELAGVIAHELGHIVARHSTIDMSYLFREVLGVSQVTDRHDIFDKYNQLIENSARKPKAFEKLDNHEEGNQNTADLIGLYAMVGAGYNPQAQAALWDRVNQLKGKTGGFLSDLFGRTRPEQKRMREMLKGLSTLPPDCLGTHIAANDTDFRQWQTSVVSYTGLGRKESLPGLLSRKTLDPGLRSDINHLRFSPDGKFLLAQDDSGINVLSRQPLASLFRIAAPDAKPALFTPDSRSIVFYTPSLHVEFWDLAEQKLKIAYEVVVRKSCLQSGLSPDGKALACLDGDFGLSLFDVASGAPIYEKKSFTRLGFSEALMLLLSYLYGDEDDLRDHEFISMAFSPDAHYFVAGDHSASLNGLGMATETACLVFDLTTRTPVPVKGDLKKIIAGGFAFVGADKIVGMSFDNLKKSGLYSFPSGEVIENFEMFTGSLRPVTSGHYALLQNLGKQSGSLLDLTTRKIFRVSQRPVLDAYDDVLASERTNSELGLYNLKGGPPEVVLLPQNPLGRLYAADVTPEFDWLALSGYSRGAVWDLTQGKRVFYVRGFRGAYLGDDKILYADFPKQDELERNVAHLNLAARDITTGAKLEGNAQQYGPFVVQIKPAKPGGGAKPGAGYGDDVIMDVFDANTLSRQWSMPFPNERPRYWILPRSGTMVLLWNTTTKAASGEIKDTPKLSTQMSTLKEKVGNYLLKVLNAKTGEMVGELLIETGKGSFRIRDVVASGDRVAISDNQNRILVYSLSSGQQLGKVFGARAVLTATGNLLSVENKEGVLEVYDLTSFERRRQYTFASPVSLVRFSPDGKRLFVLTASQTIYVLDVASQSSQSSN